MLEVTHAAPSRDLTTVSIAREALNLKTVDDDVFIGRLIRQASHAIDAYCDRVFTRQTYTETLDVAAPSLRVTLARWPVLSITGVTTLVGTTDSTGYRFDPSGILIAEAGCWLGKTVVDYQAGYVTPTMHQETRSLPYDVERACIELVKHGYQNRLRNPAVIKEELHQVATLTYSEGELPPFIRGLLAPYRRRV